MTARLVLFDFDGTITTKDTLMEFIKFYKGTPAFLIGMLVLSPVLLSYKLKIIANWKAKEILLRYFFNGEAVNTFNSKCHVFASSIVPRFVRKQALKTIQKHLNDGDRVVVVSASPENWVKPWCDQLDLQCIATSLCTDQSKLTGRISGKNCYGREKVCRIQNALRLDAFSEIIAYGDSSGDKPMLALAHQSFYKPFRN